MYPVATDRKTSITLATFQIQSNPQRIDLNCSLDRIVSVRVRSIVWSSPIIDNSSCMLYLSCPELLLHAPAQSLIMMPGTTPTNQLCHRRNLLASWVVAPQESGAPNYNTNDPQPKINLSKLTSVNKITLLVEDDSNGTLRTTPLLAYQLTQVVLEIEQVVGL